MKKGNNRTVEMFLKFIPEEDKINIDYFYYECLNRSFKRIDSVDDVSELLENPELDDVQNDYFREYSGVNYKHINAALRQTWNYEENGHVENMEKYKILGQNIRELILEHPTILKDDIMVYRGVDLSYFKQYGINSLEELVSLKDKYMLDTGLVSTSLTEDGCYFKKENDLGLNYNIKINYMVPHEFSDGIVLDKTRAYNPEQNEFLINSSSLSKVSNVTINPDGTAFIDVMLLPRQVYDKYYRQSDEKKFAE